MIELSLGQLQPYEIQLPDYVTPDGRASGAGTKHWGVLAMYWDTKTAKPGVSYFC